MARRSFVNGPVWDATQCSGSVGIATADNAIAVPIAGAKPGGGSAAAPTAATSGARKDGLTTGTGNGIPSSPGHRDGSGFPFGLFSGSIQLWGVGIDSPRSSRSPAIVQRWPEKGRAPFLRCIVCGRSGRFVDPFPRMPRFGRENR